MWKSWKSSVGFDECCLEGGCGKPVSYLTKYLFTSCRNVEYTKGGGGRCNAICVCDMVRMKRSDKWGTPLKSYLLTVVVIWRIFKQKSRSPHNTIWIIWRARRRAWFCFQNGARLHKTFLFYRTVSVRLLKNRKQIMSNTVKHLLLTLSPWDLCQSTVEKFR